MVVLKRFVWTLWLAGVSCLGCSGEDGSGADQNSNTGAPPAAQQPALGTETPASPGPLEPAMPASGQAPPMDGPFAPDPSIEAVTPSGSDAPPSTDDVVPPMPDSTPDSAPDEEPSTAGAPAPAEGMSEMGPMPPPAPAACPMSSLTPGDHDLELDHDGEGREFKVHVPASYDGMSAVPLVLDFHGWTSSATAQTGASGWIEKADAEGFIVVHPQGIDDSWNGGALCCGTAQSRRVDDEGFARAIVMRLQADACIDPQRVYATGISNGGAMSHLLACNAADVFAATAPVVMGNGARPCEPSRPVSVIMFRGRQDPLVPYNGGTFPSARADFEQWRDLNGCTGSPETIHELCETYAECDDGVEVTLCSADVGHIFYTNTQGISVADIAWEAFARQTLP